MIARAAIFACLLLAPDVAEAAQAIHGTSPGGHGGAVHGTAPGQSGGSIKGSAPHHGGTALHPSCSLARSPSSIPVFGSTALTWSSANATSMTITGPLRYGALGTVARSGTQTIYPGPDFDSLPAHSTVNVVYTGTVRNGSVSANCSVTIAVTDGGYLTDGGVNFLTDDVGNLLVAR